MSERGANQVTKLIGEMRDGRASAAAELLPLVYDELRAIALSLFKGQRRDHTLQPTALVHEAYARLGKAAEADRGGDRFNSRAHFMAVAAKAMRQILANHARDRRRHKRGGGWNRVTLTNVPTPANQSDLDLVLVDDALVRLTELDPRQSQIVELRFFADLTVEEIASVLGVSISTVEREWRMAKAWLGDELRRAADS
jgi:RNA polymerase sigma factor (TIGR02999 family)